MIATVAERTELARPLAPLAAPGLPAVDKAAQKKSIGRAFELGLALERRFELVLSGKGRRVDEVPSVKLARAVRVGDGTLAGSLGNMAKWTFLFAAPASAALLTAFGAAEVSDLALVIAGVAPFTLVPAAAIRSARAERAAKRDINRAKLERAQPDDVKPIETFVRQIAGYADPRLDAVARAVIEQWIDRSSEEGSIVPATADQLKAMRDDIPAPTSETASLGQRLISLGRLTRSLAGEWKILQSHVDILRHTLEGCTAPEREALAAPLRRILAGQTKLLAVLPSEPKESAIEKPLAITFAKDEVVAP